MAHMVRAVAEAGPPNLSFFVVFRLNFRWVDQLCQATKEYKK